jgi:hypothetical protein
LIRGEFSNLEREGWIKIVKRCWIEGDMKIIVGVKIRNEVMIGGGNFVRDNI